MGLRTLQATIKLVIYSDYINVFASYGVSIYTIKN